MLDTAHGALTDVLNLVILLRSVTAQSNLI